MNRYAFVGIGINLEMVSDLTQAYFWPAINNGPTKSIRQDKIETEQPKKYLYPTHVDKFLAWTHL